MTATSIIFRVLMRLDNDHSFSGATASTLYTVPAEKWVSRKTYTASVIYIFCSKAHGALKWVHTRGIAASPTYINMKRC